MGMYCRPDALTGRLQWAVIRSAERIIHKISGLQNQGRRVAFRGSTKLIVGALVSLGFELGRLDRVGSSGKASSESETPSPSVSVAYGLVPWRISRKSFIPSPSVSGETRNGTDPEYRVLPALSVALASSTWAPVTGL